MSYSRNYQAAIHYSGSVPYHYPASQSGGSVNVPYSGDVPVNVTINVDTAPFDGSVNRFKTSIDALGGSVAAMEAAQCIAIRKTAAEVSASLINGFFGAINTELTQQMQALDSAIKAGFALIFEQGKAVSARKDTMEGDYNRISSRYMKLFADLDEECHKRIFALDKQSFNLSEKVQNELINESSCNAAALNLLSIDEVSTSKTLVFISSLNRKALDVLRTMSDYITQESTIKKLIDSFLSNEHVDENTSLCVPVIWSESDFLEKQGAGNDCFIPDCIDQQGKQAIAEKINDICGDVSRTKWEATETSEKESINREFNLLAESHFAALGDETDQRVYKTMLSLWQNTEIFSIERSL
jgi:hypothetical protein